MLCNAAGHVKQNRLLYLSVISRCYTSMERSIEQKATGCYVISLSR